MLEEENYHREKCLRTLKVNNNNIQFEVDSSSAVSIMYIDEAKKYFRGSKVYKTKLNLITFYKSKISSIGYIKLEVIFKNHALPLNLYLTNIDRALLLGREWLYEFLKIDGNSNNFLVPIFQIKDNFKVEIDIKKFNS